MDGKIPGAVIDVTDFIKGVLGYGPLPEELENMVQDIVQQQYCEKGSRLGTIKGLEHIASEAALKGKEEEVKHLLGVIDVSREMLEEQNQSMQKLRKKKKKFKKISNDLHALLTEKEIEVSRLNAEQEFLLDNMRQLNIKFIAAQKCADDNELVIMELTEKIEKAIADTQETTGSFAELIAILQRIANKKATQESSVVNVDTVEVVEGSQTMTPEEIQKIVSG